jgi:hypothetical protein
MEAVSKPAPWSPRKPVEKLQNMNFEEFENLARLYVVGALEDGEEEAFQEARQEFGSQAEELIAEFRQLNSVFALSLRPHPPHPDTKRKLLHAIRQSMHGGRRPDGDSNCGREYPHYRLIPSNSRASRGVADEC